MKFSMNGFRRQLNADVGSLREIVHGIVNSREFDKDELVEAMNEVIQHSNVINCVFDPEDPDFVDMSDIAVETIPAEAGAES